jgi:archaellum biogenesis protein FlaJ (TadC family)
MYFALCPYYAYDKTMAAKSKAAQELIRIRDSRLSQIVTLGVVYISAGSVFYHFWEHLTWVDSFYFSVVTLGTIGYGDISPQTNVGKIFTIFYIIFGVAIFLSLVKALLVKVAKRRAKKRK